MLGFYKTLRFGAVVALAVLAVVRSTPVVGPEPIRCSPCTQQKLNNCLAVPPDCKQVLREPGCGCCMTCALEKDASCGVHTAHCGEGLHCTPRPGEARPLHALIRGQGICTEDLGQGIFSVSFVYVLFFFSLQLRFYFTINGFCSKSLQRTVMKSQIMAPCTTCWDLIFLLIPKILLRVRRASKPRSTPSATNWCSRYEQMWHQIVSEVI